MGCFVRILVCMGLYIKGFRLYRQGYIIAAALQHQTMLLQVFNFSFNFSFNTLYETVKSVLLGMARKQNGLPINALCIKPLFLCNNVQVLQRLACYIRMLTKVVGPFTSAKASPR